MRCLFFVSSWFVQRGSLTVNIDLSDVTNKYYTVLYRTVRWWYMRKRISGSRKIPTIGSTVQWETRQASFPTGTVGPRVGIFLSPLNTNDGFYLSHTPILALGKDRKQTAARWPHVYPWCHCNVKMTSPCRISAYSGFSGSLFQVFKYKLGIKWWARKRIHNSCEDGIEKSVPRDHWLSSLGKPRDANRWSSGQIFLSHLHIHDRFL